MHRSALFGLIMLGVNIGFISIPFSAQADPDSGKQARIQFEQGVTLFEGGEFEKAAIAFDRAYQLRPSYKILYNIAQVENELMHYARALEAYSKYIEEGKASLSEERVSLIKNEIERLEALVGTVVVQCPIAGAKVMLDGERRGETPLAGPIYIEMGKHEIVLRKGMREIYRESFRIAGGQQFDVSLGEEDSSLPAPVPVAAPVVEGKSVNEPKSESEPVAGQPREEALKEEEQEAPISETTTEPTGAKRVWTWVTISIGVAAGAAGGVIGGLSMKKRDDLAGSCEGNYCNESEKGEGGTIKKMNLAADVLYGVAAAGIITGIVLFFVEPNISSENTVAVAPTAWGDGAGLAISGRF